MGLAQELMERALIIVDQKHTEDELFLNQILFFDDRFFFAPLSHGKCGTGQGINGSSHCDSARTTLRTKIFALRSFGETSSSAFVKWEIWYGLGS